MRFAVMTVLLVLALPVLAACGRVTVTVEPAPLTLERHDSTANMEDPLPPSYDIYESFGLTYDREADALYFGGERVRYFFDGVDTGTGGHISRVEHIDPQGTVDVHTVRQTVDNGDGSVNPFGPLTGLEADSREDFDARDIDALLHPALEATAACSESDGTPGVTFAQVFAAYRDFGVEFLESPEGSGTGDVSFQGERVRCFSDVSPAGGAFVFHSRDGGTCDVRTVYGENGEIASVERLALQPE